MNKFLTILGVLALAVMACSPILDSVSPTRVPTAVEHYLGKEIGSANWTSLLTAQEVRCEMELRHAITALEYDAAKIQLDAIITLTKDWQTKIIGSLDQPFSVMGLLAAAGLFTGGLFTKKPGTYSKDQVEAIVAKRLNGGSSEGITVSPQAT